MVAQKCQVAECLGIVARAIQAGIPVEVLPTYDDAETLTDVVAIHADCDPCVWDRVMLYTGSEKENLGAT